MSEYKPMFMPDTSYRSMRENIPGSWSEHVGLLKGEIKGLEDAFEIVTNIPDRSEAILALKESLPTLPLAYGLGYHKGISYVLNEIETWSD